MGVVSVSIREVAARAEVSVGTVSHVLNHPERVAPATAERVRTAMSDLGFARSENARHLRSGVGRTIGLVVMDVTNPFFTDIARGVEDVASAAGMAVILCNSDEQTEKEAAYLSLLQEQRVRGVVITPVAARSRRVERLRTNGIPVVTVDTKVPKSLGCSVSVDDVTGGELAARHLVELGHRHIAFVSGPLRFKQCRDRLAGARRALTQAGLGEESLAVVDTGGLGVAAGHSGLARAMGSGSITAVLCTNDLLAVGALQCARELGIPVPDRLSVIGYDDIEFAAALSLTTVRQPRHDLGVVGTELLLAEAGADAHLHRQVVFTPELVVRETTR